MYKGERFNSVSHLLGALAGLLGLVVLVSAAAQQGDRWKIISFSVYGLSLVFLYAISTLYHSCRGRAKNLFRMLDYHAIYLLIAGTYTPFALVTLRGPWGWSLLTIVWALALIGIVLDSPPKKGRRILPVVIYLLMGWLILVALVPLLRELGLGGFSWLLAGGICYTVGVVFYALDTRIRHFHGIWHLFVLGGSVTHYIAVFHYVL